MNNSMTFCIRFSGLVVRFTFPTCVPIPEAFAGLVCEDTAHWDAHYTIELIQSPLRPEAPLFHSAAGVRTYRTEEGWLRFYSAIADKAGCEAACLFRSNAQHTLYCPAACWRRFYDGNAIITFLCGELLLMAHDAFLLHSSLVMLHGKTILFCGPSGAGKTTQAQLWQRHFGAEILNGDRTVVMKKADGFYGGGSIWSGTSGIYRSEQAPIAGVFLVGKSNRNTIRRLRAEAFPVLYSQTLTNSWDSEYTDKLCGLLSELIGQVPIYRLDCLPDENAAELAFHALFGSQ